MSCDSPCGTPQAGHLGYSQLLLPEPISTDSSHSALRQTLQPQKPTISCSLPPCPCLTPASAVPFALPHPPPIARSTHQFPPSPCPLRPLSPCPLFPPQASDYQHLTS